MDGPQPLMERAVVVPAEQDQVVQIAGSAVGPMHDVVRVAERRRAAASRVDTAAIADGECPSLSRGRGALCAADP